MKNLKFYVLAGVLIMPNVANAAYVGLCMELAACQKSLNCTSNGGYCCKTSTQTVYKCPLLWSRNASSGLCERAATSGLSDSKGTYKQNYGTCSPTTSTKDCYTYSKTNTGGCTLCYQESWQ